MGMYYGRIMMMKLGKECTGKIKYMLQDWAAPEAGERLFLCVWILFLARENLATTMFPMSGIFYNVVSLATVGGVALKVICYDSYRLPELAAVILIGGTAVLVVLRSGYQEPLFWAVILIGARGVSFRKILKTYFIVSASVVGLAFAASMLGVIVNLQYTLGSRGIRNSFGIIYPTDFAAHIFFLMVIFFYLRGARVKGWQYMICLVIAVLVYAFCNTRLDVSCMILAVVLYMGINRGKRSGRNIKERYRPAGFIKKYAMYSMPAAALFMSVLTLLFKAGGTFWQRLDEIMSNRLSLGQMGLKDYGIKLFGQQVYMMGNGGSTTLSSWYFFIDCSYLYILLKYGIIFLSIVLTVYVLCCRKYQDDKRFLLMIALVSLNCMIAHHLVELAYCPFALAVFAKREFSSEKGTCKLKQLEKSVEAEASHG